MRRQKKISVVNAYVDPSLHEVDLEMQHRRMRSTGLLRTELKYFVQT